MEPESGWVYIEDHKIAYLIELIKTTDGGVFLLTIHKKRLVKVQPLSKENLLDVMREQNLAQRTAC